LNVNQATNNPASTNGSPIQTLGATAAPNAGSPSPDAR
jgi:hypothetical protein